MILELFLSLVILVLPHSVGNNKNEELLTQTTQRDCEGKYHRWGVCETHTHTCRGDSRVSSSRSFVLLLVLIEEVVVEVEVEKGVVEEWR